MKNPISWEQQYPALGLTLDPAIESHRDERDVHE